MSHRKSKGQGSKDQKTGQWKAPDSGFRKSVSSAYIRRKAEETLAATRQTIKTLSLTEFQELVHELQVQQVELEMQNEELCRTQLELSQAYDRYAELYDFAPSGFLTLNAQGTVLEANLTACRLLGTNRASLIGKQLEPFFLAQDQARFRKHLQASLSSQSVQISDVFVLAHDHSDSMVKLESHHSLQEVSHPDSFLRVALIDVTEQMRAIRAREKQENWMASILNSAMDAIITVNAQQEILLFNKAAEEMFRIPAKEAVGQSIDRFIPEGFRRDHRAHIQKFAQGDMSSRGMGALGEITGLRADGSEFPAEGSISKAQSGVDVLLTVILRDITSRKVVDAGLRYLSRQHQLLLHSVGEGIYGMDLLGHVTFYNRAAETMTGWKQEEILGKFVHSLIHHTKPDGTPNLWEGCRVHEVLIFGGENHVEDEVLWRKDGSSFYVDYRCNSIHDEQGKVVGVVVIFRDVTERKEQHLHLLALANRNQALLDAIPDLVVEVDAHKRMVWLNREALRFYGAGAVGKEPREFFVGEQDTYQSVQPLFEGVNTVIHLESWQRRVDGQPRLLEWWCRCLKDAQGTVIGAISTGRDVTERQRASDRLLESERRLRMMVEHLPDGAVFTDGTTLIINEAVVRMTGYSKVDLSTVDEWFRLLHRADESIMRKLYQQDRQGGFAHTRLLPIHRKDGALRYVEFSRYGWDKGEVWLVHDVTDQHEARIALLENKHLLETSQEELRTLTAKLLTAQEDERRRISRDLHDDMNQRLAVLALKIQTGQKNLEPSSSMYHVFQQLYEEVSGLSDDLRHLAYQLHPSILDDLGLKLALQSLIDDFIKWEKIPITFTAEQVPAILPQDISSCLYRLVQESLRNISKYARATQVRVRLTPLNGGIQLEIEDDGRGFDPHGVSVKKGLGLIGMQERIRLVNGTWSILSHPGDGVTVSAWVPLPKGGI